MNRRVFLASSLAWGTCGASAKPVPEGLRRLAAAYPAQISHAQPDALIWRDGSRMAWSDGVAGKSFVEKLMRPDLSDQMAIPYVAGPIRTPPQRDGDPGRIRYQPFFEKLYGRSEAEIRANLIPVRWAPAGSTVVVSRVNGIDRLLSEIGEDIARLPRDLARLARRPAGGFNYRNVAGTRYKSAHAFGIAFDLDSRLTRYWRWDRGPGRPSDVPYALVELFERRKFIWGGKWFHYDTMHFEYRPELF
jgi:hypothetical protein